MILETDQEFYQDVILAVMFGFLALVSGYRSYLYFTLQGSGKVVTLFYALIFSTSFVRSVWFGIPSIFLEGSYLPKGVVAFQSSHWQGVLVSELLLSIGTVGLYAVFILLIAFWANMLNKVEQNENSPHNVYSANRKPRGPLETFLMVIVALLVMEAVNVVLFLCRVYNAEVMILYDSALFSVVSLTCLYGISFFSSRIRIILQTLGYINNKSTKKQVQRILAITLSANIFFLLRVIIEVCIAITLILHFVANEKFIFVKSHAVWSKFILMKHWLEVIILGLELVVSTSLSSGTHSRHQTTRVTAESDSRRRSNKPRRGAQEQDEFLPTTPPPAPTGASHGTGTSAAAPTEKTPLLKKHTAGTRYSL